MTRRRRPSHAEPCTRDGHVAPAIDPIRRSLMLTAVAAGTGALVGYFNSKTAAKLDLVVFLHTHLDARSLERRFEAALPGVSVEVLTRSRDFTRVRSRNPDAVMALAPVLEAHGLATDLQGKRQGQPKEPYSLLSVGATSPVSVTSVGAVDILGRAGTTEFVGDLLGSRKASVAPVTKLVDLLALLQFEKVEAVLVPGRQAEWLSSRTRLSLTRIDLGGRRIGLPAVSTLGPSGAELCKLLMSLPSSLQGEIGVDSWR